MSLGSVGIIDIKVSNHKLLIAERREREREGEEGGRERGRKRRREKEGDKERRRENKNEQDHDIYQYFCFQNVSKQSTEMWTQKQMDQRRLHLQQANRLYCQLYVTQCYWTVKIPIKNKQTQMKQTFATHLQQFLAKVS